MRRVGIMSMQRIRNYGSTLQAYGLKRSIESLGGNEVSFLDYEPGEPLVAASAPTSTWRRSIAKLREYNDVDAGLVDRVRFFDHKRGYAQRYLPMVGVLDDAGGDVDVQVIGSDEVFNCFQSNTNVGYSRQLFGASPRAPRVVSYAASFGNATLERIDGAGLRDQVAGDLATFDALSVRDRNSAGIVEALTGTTPDVHVDPVLLHEWASHDEPIPRGRMLDDPYLVVYGYSGRLDDAENRAIRDHARRRGLTVVGLGGVQGSVDRFVDANPFELLAWFRDAEGVVTDTFHGTIFAMINHVPFATIVRPSLGDDYGNEEKLGFLLESFGLQAHRMVDVAGVSEFLDVGVDGARLDERLQSERQRALRYLASAVNGDTTDGGVGS